MFENLTEEAFALEETITEKYRQEGQCQCGLAKGGTGGTSSAWTPEFKEYWPKCNPMKQEAQRQRVRENNPIRNKKIALKNGEKHKRAVIINGIYYSGVIDAARACNVCDVTITSWCKRGY